MAEVNGWEVRLMALNDPRRRVCVQRGLMHLQLWHPRHMVSVLTPSKLTMGHYEVCTRHQIARLCNPQHLGEYLTNHLEVPLPDLAVVLQFERLFVHMSYLGASLGQQEAPCEGSSLPSH